MIIKTLAASTTLAALLGGAAFAQALVVQPRLDVGVPAHIEAAPADVTADPSLNIDNSATAPTTVNPVPTGVYLPAPPIATQAPVAARANAAAPQIPGGVPVMINGEPRILVGTDTALQLGIPIEQVRSRPVPDTPENRALYGGPMSRTGRATAPAGN